MPGSSGADAGPGAGDRRRPADRAAGSPMSSSRNMPTIAHCTARPRSWRGRGVIDRATLAFWIGYGAAKSERSRRSRLTTWRSGALPRSTCAASRWRDRDRVGQPHRNRPDDRLSPTGGLRHACRQYRQVATMNDGAICPRTNLSAKPETRPPTSLAPLKTTSRCRPSDRNPWRLTNDPGKRAISW